jgi:hypothetical protein
VASDFEVTCDAILADLTSSVSGVRDAITHRYAPWNPEELVAEDGNRHLAVWPLAEGAEASSPLTTNSHMLTQLYRILYWEPSPDESLQGLDEDAAADLLSLQNAIRARFYIAANQTIGGNFQVWYEGTTLPERSLRVRTFAMTVSAQKPIDFV